MESKTWLWKRKSSEKNAEKEKALVLARSVEELNGQLSSLRNESNAKDDLLSKQAKVAEEAISGWEKAEAQTLSLRQQLDDALLQKKTAEERVIEKDIALKECTQLLRAAKEDQQIIVNNASVKISREQEKVHLLEQRLSETKEKVTELVSEIGNLNRILVVKDQLLQELSESKSKLEANFNEAMCQLDSLEKVTASLKYEICVLRKELDIRDGERELSRRSTDAAHRQQLEGIKKIAKLESECQRLRVMVRKRSSGQQPLAKMRSEIDFFGNNSVETRRKRSTSFGDCYDLSSKDIAALVERLNAAEDENKALQESLAKKSSELQASRIMFARTASKLSQIESQVEELSKGQTYDLAKHSPVPHDLTLSYISEHSGNEDNISCADSWASALISELEHFKCGKPSPPSWKSVGVSELSLMDDFAEMEKLAVITVDKHFDGPLGAETDDISEDTSMKIVPIKDVPDCNEAGNDKHAKYMSFENYPIWLQDILRVIVQKHRIMQKSLSVILEDVKDALNDWDYSVKEINLDSLKFSEKDQQPEQTSFDGAIGSDLLNTTGSDPDQICLSNLEKPVRRLIDLVEGIIQRDSKSKFGQDSLAGDDEGASLQQKSSSGNGYVARAFLWEVSDLSAVLQKFIAVCNDLLDRKIDVPQFTDEVASALDSIVSHCFSRQDIWDMKESICKRMDADGCNELKAAICQTKGMEKSDAHEESNITEGTEKPPLSASTGLYILSRMEDIELKLKDENERLNSEIVKTESRRKDLEETLKQSSTRNEALEAQLQQSKESISDLQIELAALKEAKGQIEDLVIRQKVTNEDLETHFAVAKAELDEFHQKFPSLEVELKDKSDCCKELEATCLQMQLQLESASLSEENPKYIVGPEEKQIVQERDIAAASEKLAACQETILNQRKQLKSLASPRLFDQVTSSPTAARSNCQTQRITHLRGEDHPLPEEPKSPNTKETATTEGNSNASLLNGHNSGINHDNTSSASNFVSASNVTNKHKGRDGARMIMIVTKRHGGVRLLRKLLAQRKRKSPTRPKLPSVA